jgi:hypothetical protein
MWDFEYGGGGSSFRSKFPECNKSNNAEEDKRLEFLVAHYGYVQGISQTTAVPSEWILAWAAYEGGWGFQNASDSKAIHNTNFYGLRAGSNWQMQSRCGPDALSGWACFASFDDSTYAALMSTRTNPKTRLQWTAAGMLADEFGKGTSIMDAFQQLAELGHDAANTHYGSDVAGVKITHRVDCLRKFGYIE